MLLDQNRRHYEAGTVAARYASRCGLQPAEAVILDRFRHEIAGKRILDLGVGGGRTTPFLLELSSNYVGVDYSRHMIERCRERFPGVTFDIVDARDLSRFPDQSFDFALFSHSGIDAVEHEGRLKVLSEVRRVLCEGGLFVFSSHNRNYAIPRPWVLDHFAGSFSSPLRFAKSAAAYPIGILNYARRAHHAEAHEEYCISVDSAYHYSLVHYRIAPHAQTRQLERIGFTSVEIVGVDGATLSLGDAEARVRDPWFQYICRRRP